MKEEKKIKREQFSAWAFTLWLPEDDSIQDVDIELTEKVRWCKWALERGENSGRLHIQGYVVFARNQDLGYAIRWVNSLYPPYEGDVKPRSQSHELMKSYIGNPDFVHKDGRKKGGDVLWVREIGDDSAIGKRGGRSKELSKTDSGLEEIRKSIDDGESIAKIWKTHFPLMVRYCKGIYTYYELYHPNRREIGESIFQSVLSEQEHKEITSYFERKKLDMESGQE